MKRLKWCLVGALAFGVLTALRVWAASPTQIVIRNAAPDPSEAGQGVVVFTDLTSGAGAPTGTIFVTDGPSGCSFSLPQTYCLYIPSTDGVHSLTAQYGGDVDFDPSASSPVQHTSAAAGYPRRISLGSGSTIWLAPALKGGVYPVLSGDGRTVAFQSTSPNLVGDGATNAISGIFMREQRTAIVARVDLGSDSVPANGPSSRAAVSTDGRFVAFVSAATNLVAGDTNGVDDIFVRDRVAGTTVRASVDSTGVQANAASESVSISAGGRYVVFTSNASNLVAGDTNGTPDVFFHDLVSGETSRVDVTSTGAQVSFGATVGASISDDGRYIAFASGANDLVAGDTNGRVDIFLRDRQLGATTRVSGDANGNQGNGDAESPRLTPDAHFLLFTSAATQLVAGDTNGRSDVFLRDLQTDVVERVSVASGAVQGDGRSYGGVLTPDARYISFTSEATNLDVDDTDAFADVFRRDRVTGWTQRASLATGGSQGNGVANAPSMADDGDTVGFNSAANNLGAGDFNGTFDALVHHFASGVTDLVSAAVLGNQGDGPSGTALELSADGRFAAFSADADNLVANDTNHVTDLFVRDLDAGTLDRISVNANGEQANGASYSVSLSASGRYVAFTSAASNLVANDTNNAGDIFRLDRQTGDIARASVSSAGVQANDFSSGPIISADGRYIAFYSNATNLIAELPGYARAVLHDMETGTTVRISVSSAGVPANQLSSPLAMSADARSILFSSDATNLVPADTNNATDLFLRDTQNGTTTRISVGPGGVQANRGSFGASISADGRFVLFSSDATNLVADDTNGNTDVFLRDLQEDTITRINVDPAGAQAIGGTSRAGRMSADGRFAAFYSAATNLVSGDTNGLADAFVRDLQSGSTRRFDVDATGAQANSAVTAYTTSADGHVLAFVSQADNLVAGDTNGYADSFVTVNPLAISATTVTIDAITPSPSIVNEMYTVSVSVSATDGTPRGQVSIPDGAGSGCVAQLAGGHGSCSFASLHAGSLTLTADYAGGAGYLASSATASHEVNRASTSTTIESSGNPVVVGESFTVTARVASMSPGMTVPSGTAELLDGTTSLGSVDLSGLTATFSVSTLGAGEHLLSVAYAGNSNFTGSTSTPLNQTILRAATTLQIIGFTPESPWAGESVHVAFALSGGVSPGGTMTIAANSGEACTTDVATGGCELVFAASGAHSVVATYAGDADNAPSSSASVTIAVESTVDLSITNSDGRPFASGGSTVEYTIVVNNRGPDAATNARVQDIVPGNLLAATWTCEPVLPASCTAAGSGSIDDTVTIPPDGSITYRLIGTVAALPEIDLVTQATISAAQGTHESAASDNAAHDTDTVGIFYDGFE